MIRMRIEGMKETSQSMKEGMKECHCWSHLLHEMDESAPFMYFTISWSSK